MYLKITLFIFILIISAFGIFLLDHHQEALAAIVADQTDPVCSFDFNPDRIVVGISLVTVDLTTTESVIPVTFSYNGTPVSPTWITDTHYSFSWDTTSLAAATYVFEATVKDIVGNSGSCIGTFVIKGGSWLKITDGDVHINN